MSFKPEDVYTIELGLINKCNNICPLCLRNDKELMSHTVKNQRLEFNALCQFLDSLVNLERVVLMGAVSEPTLYPELFDLIRYMKGRGLRVRISTNGSANKVEWWRELGQLLDKNDIIRFPIDGSTNELHQKYRRGSTIEKVLERHRAFKFNEDGTRNSECTTILQHIQFKYNEHDAPNIRDIYFREDFDLLEMSPCYEPKLATPGIIEQGIIPIDRLMLYQKLKNKAIDEQKSEYIEIPGGCPEANDNAVYLGHAGVLVPCNEQEDDHFKMDNVVNIYDNTLEDVFDYLNEILDNINTCETCHRSCTKMGQKECHVFPITQYNKIGDKYELIDFRECMKR